LIFDKVTDKNKLAPFYGPMCNYMYVVTDKLLKRII